jgi:hypothetical protein
MSRIKVHRHPWLPRTMLEPCADIDERWHAMTFHHLALGVIPLEEPTEAMFVVDGELLAHPTVVDNLILRGLANMADEIERTPAVQQATSLTWTCAECTSVNVIERTHCSRCGARRPHATQS